MKKAIIVLTVAFVLMFACGAQAIHETVPSETQIPEPGPDAVKLYDYIAKYKPYTDWQLFPGKGKLYPGTQPHGAFLTTYVNNTAYYSIKDKKGMAYGSIIVKENYTTDKKLDSLTVMYKIRRFNPMAGDWFWAKYAPDGKIIVSGRVPVCIKCHVTRKDKTIFSPAP